MRGVFLGEALPLLRQVVEGEDCGDGANGNASAAVDTFDGVDVELFSVVELALIFFGVDAVNGACIHTCCVFGADAGFCDNVSHSDPL
jgi:hypothetical protein